MPYELRWIPPPTDASLPVLKEKPGGAKDRFCFGGPPTINVGADIYHECPKCDGWVPGPATESRVDTLAPLSGRRGIEFFCRRCGYEIAFSGMMS